MSVSTRHPEYSFACKRYELIRSIIRNDAKKYIRKPDPIDDARNCQYRDDAILTNFTALTCEAFVGLVFRKKLRTTLPEELNYLFDDITGSGINLWQFSQTSVSELLQLGRYGYLIDFEVDAQKAFIKPYVAESIINWKAERINGVVQPWLIVLTESVVKDDDDMFCQDALIQYRVLMLDENGTYIQHIYNQDEELIGAVMPVDYNGKPFNYIPFIFVGSENNDWVVDKEPLYDMARINLGHYQDSADYQESIYVCGQPYLVINPGDTSQEEFTNVNPSGVSFGSRKGLVLANGGNAQLLQANPNQLVAQAMKDKLEQAAKVGARLVEPSGGRETAEAAKIRYASQNSALYKLTSNCSWAIEDALEIICQFMGLNPDSVSFKLNDQFFDESADGNVMNSYMQWFDRGIVSADEVREYGRRTGIIDEDRTDSEIDNSVDTKSNPLLDMTNDPQE